MTTVYVVSYAADSEGGTPIGVAASRVTARAIAETHAGKSLPWEGNFARLGPRPYSIDYYEFTPMEVQP